MSHIVSQFRALSLKQKGLVVLVVLILMAMISLWVGLWITSNKNAIIAAKQAELEDERERLRKQQERADIEENRLAIERTTAISKAQAEELRAVKAELITRHTQSDLQYTQAELQSLNRRRAKEQRDYEEKIKAITASIDDACQRWLRVCATAKRLGIRTAEQPCECAR